MSMKAWPFPPQSEESLQLGDYQPSPPNASGLRMAWVLFTISLMVGLYMLYFNFTLPVIFYIATVLLLLVALAISLSYWLERNAVISVSEQGVGFRSPIRRVFLDWNEIEELWCGAIRGGWRFMVSGEAAAFRFQSLIVLRSGTGREVRSGFPEGVRIAQTIFNKAGLTAHKEEQDIYVFRKPS